MANSKDPFTDLLDKIRSLRNLDNSPGVDEDIGPPDFMWTSEQEYEAETVYNEKILLKNRGFKEKGFQGRCYSCGNNGHRKSKCPVKQLKDKIKRNDVEKRRLEEELERRQIEDAIKMKEEENLKLTRELEELFGPVSSPSVGGERRLGEEGEIEITRKVSRRVRMRSHKKATEPKKKKDKVCWGCGEEGHKMEECRKAKKKVYGDLIVYKKSS